MNPHLIKIQECEMKLMKQLDTLDGENYHEIDFEKNLTDPTYVMMQTEVYKKMIHDYTQKIISTEGYAPMGKTCHICNKDLWMSFSRQTRSADEAEDHFHACICGKNTIKAK